MVIQDIMERVQLVPPCSAQFPLTIIGGLGSLLVVGGARRWRLELECQPSLLLNLLDLLHSYRLPGLSLLGLLDWQRDITRDLVQSILLGHTSPADLQTDVEEKEEDKEFREMVESVIREVIEGHDTFREFRVKSSSSELCNNLDISIDLLDGI